MKKILVLFWVIIFLVSFTLSLSATGQEENVQEAELTHVKIGITPYSMYQIWYIAKDYGIDKEFGLDIELFPVTQTMNGVQALIRGDLDITANCIAEHLPTFETAPHVIAFSTIGFFQGFIFVGRQGEFKSIEDLVAEMGIEAAKEFRLKEFEGKSFNIIPQRKALILDAIQQVGLTADDVEFINFADDQKAAVAFIAGTGDFYIGSLPQERKLIKMEDEYVNAGGSEILGPGGLWYDTMVSTDTFMTENKETALALLGVLYRTIRLFDEKTEEVAIIGAKGISEVTGGDFSVDEYIQMQTVYDDFLSIADAKEGYYNSGSSLYWAYPVEYYAKMAVEQGDLKGPIVAADYYMDSENMFFEFLKRNDLMSKVEASF